MESLLSGPYASLMVVAAFGLFAWLFFDLMEEMRDGGEDRGPFFARAGASSGRDPQPGGRPMLRHDPSAPTPRHRPAGANRCNSREPWRRGSIAKPGRRAAASWRAPTAAAGSGRCRARIACG